MFHRAATIFFLAAMTLPYPSPLWANDCPCAFQKARSESNAGSCKVRETLTTDCNIIWVVPTQPAATSAQASDGAAVGLILQAAARPASTDQTGQFNEMSNPEFWQGFRARIDSLPSSVPGGRLADNCLAFLTDEKLTRELQSLVPAALVLVVADLFADKRLAKPPEVALRIAFLEALLSRRSRLIGFAGPPLNFLEKMIYEGKAELEGVSIPVSITFEVQRGCLEMWDERNRTAAMIKTPGAPQTADVRVGRCRFGST